MDTKIIHNDIKADKFMYIFFGIYIATILLGSTCLYISFDILFVCTKIIIYMLSSIWYKNILGLEKWEQYNFTYNRYINLVNINYHLFKK